MKQEGFAELYVQNIVPHGKKWKRLRIKFVFIANEAAYISWRRVCWPMCEDVVRCWIIVTVKKRGWLISQPFLARRSLILTLGQVFGFCECDRRDGIMQPMMIMQSTEGASSIGARRGALCPRGRVAFMSHAAAVLGEMNRWHDRVRTVCRRQPTSLRMGWGQDRRPQLQTGTCYLESFRVFLPLLCHVVPPYGRNCPPPPFKGRSARDALPHTSRTPIGNVPLSTCLISACSNEVKKKYYHNETYLQRICQLNYQLWCCFWHKLLVESPINGDQWLTWKVCWHALAFVTHEITWRPLYVIGFNHGLPCYVKNMARGTQVDKNRGRRPRFLSWLRPEGHVFNIALQAMIKTYYGMSPFAIQAIFSNKNVGNVRIRVQWPAPDHVARHNGLWGLLLWVGCLATYINRKLLVPLLLWHNGC